MSKQQINERAYMQKIAGLITESEYVAIVEAFTPSDTEDPVRNTGDVKTAAQRAADAETELFLGKNKKQLVPRVDTIVRGTSTQADPAAVDIITDLIANKFFDGEIEKEDGVMLNSFTKGRLGGNENHNQVIRKFIRDLSGTKGVDANTAELYAKKFD